MGRINNQLDMTKLSWNFSLTNTIYIQYKVGMLRASDRRSLLLEVQWQTETLCAYESLSNIVPNRHQIISRIFYSFLYMTSCRGEGWPIFGLRRMFLRFIIIASFHIFFLCTLYTFAQFHNFFLKLFYYRFIEPSPSLFNTTVLCK